ncbi:MAG: hypothetical protein H0V33_06265 [Acidimicrobiia bacterium]|jgi:hypothetical protein|nr:hypothetical protein [Acidimicrobiia bacterium]
MARSVPAFDDAMRGDVLCPCCTVAGWLAFGDRVRGEAAAAAVGVCVTGGSRRCWC